MYIHQHQRFANNNWLPTASILLPAAMKHLSAINTSCKRLAGHYTEALWMAGTYWCIRMRMKTGRRYYRLLRIDRHDRWSHQRSSIHYRRLRSRCITIAWCSSCWHRHCHTRTCCWVYRMTNHSAPQSETRGMANAQPITTQQWLIGI